MLAPTWWTVRAKAFTSIVENYVALLDTRTIAHGESSDSEMRARIGGVAKQMESFDFYFGVELGRKIFSMADNLSSTLQGSTVSASEGQSVMKMTITALQGIRSDEAFLLFWKYVDNKRLQLEPRLPRRRKVPRRLEVGETLVYIMMRVCKTYIDVLTLKLLIM